CLVALPQVMGVPRFEAAACVSQFLHVSSRGNMLNFNRLGRPLATPRGDLGRQVVDKPIAAYIMGPACRSLDIGAPSCAGPMGSVLLQTSHLDISSENLYS